VCAGAWTRCCSGDARSTEVVAALAAPHSWTLVSAPDSRRRFTTTLADDVSRLGTARECLGCDSDPLFHPKTAGAE